MREATMTGSAQYLLYSYAEVAAPHQLAVASRLAGRDRDGPWGHASFAALEGHAVMELTALVSLDDLPGVLSERADVERAVASRMAGEWHHAVLAHVEDLVPGRDAITASPMVEMRRIEVPPPVYGDYRDWRERTIYAALRDRAEIDDFRSYQSVISTEPGVMFVVGFSGDPQAYQAIYQTPTYRGILNEAGARYIAGGLAGLDCRSFARPTLLASQGRAS